MSKTKSKKLTTIGTHVPLEVKETIQALAESRNTSVYSLLQECIIALAEQYEAEIEELKTKKEKQSQKTVSNESDLLG